MGDDGLRGFMRDVNKEGDLDKRDLNKGNAKKPAPARNPQDQGIRTFLEKLEKTGEMVRVTKEVDPSSNLSAIEWKTYDQHGKATIFDNVKDNFKIMTEEPFGPLSPITTFKSFDEVIKRANNHSAGLAGYVCTNSMHLAHKTSEALETGMVAINTPFLSSAETPFGGIKQSGYGREGGSVGIKDYLNIKYTHLGLQS